ncbi:MAG TPA: hypothetical protein VF955_10055 [Pyrinomonadaceae bacterium]
MRFSAILFLLGALVTGTFAQRARSVDPSPNSKAAPAPAPAAQTVRAKYEGGIIGYNRKQEGTLSFDDVNHRLVFRNKEQREVFFIPYEAISATYPDTQSRRPTAASVLGSVPAPYGLNIPAWFIKKKYRYLTINFEDPDTNVSGITSFNLHNKETVASVMNTLASKAGLTQRGDGYIRKKTTAQTTTTHP